MPADPAELSRRWKLVVAGIVGLAACLRVSGIATGVPFRMSADEPAVLSIVLGMMKSGDFNPHFFDYGGLIFYFHLAVAVVTFLWGATAGRWIAVDQIWVGDLLLLARSATVILATLTVYLVWRIGLRWGAGVALLGLTLMAIQPQHVRESHFALTDVPLTFCITLSMLLSLRASEVGAWRAFGWAGLAAGAAAAVKYNGALAVAMPIAAALTAPAVTAVGPAIAASLGGAVLGFLIGAPYSLFDLPGFLNGFAVLLQSYNQPRPATQVAVSYLKYMRNWFGWQGVLSVQIGWLALLVGGIGLVALLAELRFRSRLAASLIAVVFPSLYFWLIVAQGSLQYGRYLLPITPMFCIVLASGMMTIWKRLLLMRGPWRPVSQAALLALVLIPPLGTSVTFDLDQRRLGTAEQAGNWILENVRPAERIVMERSAVRLPPRFQVEDVAQVIDRPMAAYRDAGMSYLVTTSAAADRYHPTEPARRAEDLAALSVLMRAGHVVATFPATEDHPGDTVTIIKVPK
jgi:4-amino-4-deoxy-L-arabinose transferase-like glycosyltransferase